MNLGGYFCAYHEHDGCHHDYGDDELDNTHARHLIFGGLEFNRPAIKTSALCQQLYQIIFSLQIKKYLAKNFSDKYNLLES